MDQITELTMSKIAAAARFETLRDEAEGPTLDVKPGGEFPVLPAVYPAEVRAAGRHAVSAIDVLVALVRDDRAVAELKRERDDVAAYIDEEHSS